MFEETVYLIFLESKNSDVLFKKEEMFFILIELAVMVKIDLSFLFQQQEFFQPKKKAFLI